MVRRLTAILFSVALMSMGGAVLTSQAAHADPCPAGTPRTSNCGLSLSQYRGPVGTTVTARAQGFTKNCTVRITFGGTRVASAVSNNQGTINPTSFNVPNKPAGEYTVTAKDVCNNIAYSKKFAIPPAGGGSGPPADKCPTNSPRYPSKTCGIALSQYVGPSSTRVTVRGQGFSKNCQVRIRFDGTLVATAQSNGAGTISPTDFVVPKRNPGTYTVTARDQCQGIQFSKKFRVTTASSSALPHTTGPFGNLPHTGAVIYPMTGAGVVALAFGTGLIFAGRRRRLSSKV
jgi:hypothetical protein